MLTQAELSFLERVPNLLRDIAIELAEHNKLLKEQNELFRTETEELTNYIKGE